MMRKWEGSLKILLVSIFAFVSVSSMAYGRPHSESCYAVSQFFIVYETPHPEEVPIDRLLNLPIELSIGPDGYIAPLESEKITIALGEFSGELDPDDVPGQGFFKGFTGRSKPSYCCFHTSGLQAICASLVHYLTQEGLSGVSVRIASDEITPDGLDCRGGSHHQLTLKIRLAVVGEVGALRIDENTAREKLPGDHQLSYIVANSPLQPSSNRKGNPDLFSKDQLDDYLSFLNRHPNRKVDARIYSLHQENQVGIDFLVSENRPWRFFFDVNNNGNHVTGLWQETIGFLNTQLTGVDDVFRFDWTTDSFHSYYTFIGSYDRPFLSCRKARWKIFGMFNRFAASDLGFQDKIFVGTQGVADLSFRENAAQKGSFFFDLTEGLRYYNIHVTNRLDDLIGKGHTQFAAPTLAIHFDQAEPAWRFSMKFEGQTSPNGFLASNRKEIDLLGRLDTSKGWTILNGNFLAGFYVNADRPVNEFIFFMQGQYAFNYRLIPQLKFVVGGFNTVRGYTEAINSGDSAFVGRAEYLFHLAPLFSPDPSAKTQLFGRPFRPFPEYTGGRADWDAILRTFVDAARSVDNNRIEGLEEDSTLISTGLGAEVVLWQNLMIRMDWGITLQKAENIGVGHSIVYLNSTVAY